jgi:translation initiation factor eIF-2B subunit epsilon
MEASDVSQSTFRREVSETLLRCKQDGFHQNNAVIELNALKIAEDRTFADCARFILVTILGAIRVPRKITLVMM